MGDGTGAARLDSKNASESGSHWVMISSEPEREGKLMCFTVDRVTSTQSSVQPELCVTAVLS